MPKQKDTLGEKKEKIFKVSTNTKKLRSSTNNITRQCLLRQSKRQVIFATKKQKNTKKKEKTQEINNDEFMDRSSTDSKKEIGTTRRKSNRIPKFINIDDMDYEHISKPSFAKKHEERNSQNFSDQKTDENNKKTNFDKGLIESLTKNILFKKKAFASRLRICKNRRNKASLCKYSKLNKKKYKRKQKDFVVSYNSSKNEENTNSDNNHQITSEKNEENNNDDENKILLTQKENTLIKKNKAYLSNGEVKIKYKRRKLKMKGSLLDNSEFVISVCPDLIVIKSEILNYDPSNDISMKKKKKVPVLPENEAVINSYVKYMQYFNESTQMINFPKINGIKSTAVESLKTESKENALDINNNPLCSDVINHEQNNNNNTLITSNNIYNYLNNPSNPECKEKIKSKSIEKGADTINTITEDSKCINTLSDMEMILSISKKLPPQNTNNNKNNNINNDNNNNNVNNHHEVYTNKTQNNNNKENNNNQSDNQVTSNFKTKKVLFSIIKNAPNINYNPNNNCYPNNYYNNLFNGNLSISNINFDDDSISKTKQKQLSKHKGKNNIILLNYFVIYDI